MKFTHAVELTIRGHDRLDEAMHAGYFFYILVGTSSQVCGNRLFHIPSGSDDFLPLLACDPQLLQLHVRDPEERPKIRFGGQGLMVAAYLSLGVSLIILPKVVLFFYQVKANNASLWTEAFNYLYSINS